LEKTEERPESNSHSYYDEDETACPELVSGTVFFKRTFGLHTNALFINSNILPLKLNNTTWLSDRFKSFAVNFV